MAFSEIYRRQVALLLRILPIVAEEDCFALKGGTAINLFVRDMPRLSVDIDLTYLPTHGRVQALATIDVAMRRTAERARKTAPGSRVTETLLQAEGTVTKLLVRADGVQTKIEVTPSCAAPFTRRAGALSRRRSKPLSDSRRFSSCHSRTSMPGKW